MRFWDSSAIVPLVLDETSSEPMRALADDGASLAVWWTTRVECFAAIARRERHGDTASDQADLARTTLGEIALRWVETPPTEHIRSTAQRLVSMHDIRTADALQLAAAHAVGDGQPEGLPFVTLDDRLALAARREGFPVLP